MDTLSGSVCRACRLRLFLNSPSSSFSSATTIRTFASTSSRLHIPPESPAFIDVPEPHQPVGEPKPQVKGILPVPRELFPRRRPDKPGQEYLANVTRDPLPKNVPHPDHLSETGRYKQRMAELRKAQLREGLQELHRRKVHIDGQIAYRSQARQKQNARLTTQAQREDERLTNATVPSAMKLRGGHHELSPEDEDALYDSRVQAYQAKRAAKHADRLDRLHTLYMNARHFITTKEQLADAIDQAFQTTKSIWDRQGPPDTVEDMIRRGRDRTGDQGRGGLRLSSEVNERVLKDQERMQKIAEKLSGGKM
ncbi:hypothetical protein PV08_05036 [Exophiala spinifera]|uniref:Uncharacterized protein n=1 Tax=Exophiala spinifera TaxID=91928 RepID=A0A0D1YRF6_9EURO|nr:uncharacterized protein PV08_05036 [Exophiala spinifera]KIW17841.1 hypothetical protein PV08_05036 [Exophiala spinifera]